MPVQRIIRGVEVEDDLLRGATVRIEEQIDEQRLNRLPVMADPVIPRRLHLAQFQPVQRALAGERCAVRPTCREFPRQHRKGRRRTFADSEPRCTCTRVESRTGAAAALRFPSPLIKPDVRISRIRLSDWFHPAAIDGAPMWSRRSRTTPSFPNTT